MGIYTLFFGKKLSKQEQAKQDIAKVPNEALKQALTALVDAAYPEGLSDEHKATENQAGAEEVVLDATDEKQRPPRPRTKQDKSTWVDDIIEKAGTISDLVNIYGYLELTNNSNSRYEKAIKKRRLELDLEEAKRDLTKEYKKPITNKEEPTATIDYIRLTITNSSFEEGLLDLAKKMFYRNKIKLELLQLNKKDNTAEIKTLEKHLINDRLNLLSAKIKSDYSAKKLAKSISNACQAALQLSQESTTINTWFTNALPKCATDPKKTKLLLDALLLCDDDTKAHLNEHILKLLADQITAAEEKSKGPAEKAEDIPTDPDTLSAKVALTEAKLAQARYRKSKEDKKDIPKLEKDLRTQKQAASKARALVAYNKAIEAYKDKLKKDQQIIPFSIRREQKDGNKKSIIQKKEAKLNQINSYIESTNALESEFDKDAAKNYLCIIDNRAQYEVNQPLANAMIDLYKAELEIAIANNAATKDIEKDLAELKYLAAQQAFHAQSQRIKLYSIENPTYQNLITEARKELNYMYPLYAQNDPTFAASLVKLEETKLAYLEKQNSTQDTGFWPWLKTSEQQTTQEDPAAEIKALKIDLVRDKTLELKHKFNSAYAKASQATLDAHTLNAALGSTIDNKITAARKHLQNKDTKANKTTVALAEALAALSEAVLKQAHLEKKPDDKITSDDLKHLETGAYAKIAYTVSSKSTLSSTATQPTTPKQIEELEKALIRDKLNELHHKTTAPVESNVDEDEKDIPRKFSLWRKLTELFAPEYGDETKNSQARKIKGLYFLGQFDYSLLRVLKDALVFSVAGAPAIAVLKVAVLIANTIYQAIHARFLSITEPKHRNRFHLTNALVTGFFILFVLTLTGVVPSIIPAIPVISWLGPSINVLLANPWIALNYIAVEVLVGVRKMEMDLQATINDTFDRHDIGKAQINMSMIGNLGAFASSILLVYLFSAFTLPMKIKLAVAIVTVSALISSLCFMLWARETADKEKQEKSSGTSLLDIINSVGLSFEQILGIIKPIQQEEQEEINYAKNEKMKAEEEAYISNKSNIFQKIGFMLRNPSLRNFFVIIAACTGAITIIEIIWKGEVSAFAKMTNADYGAIMGGVNSITSIGAIGVGIVGTAADFTSRFKALAPPVIFGFFATFFAISLAAPALLPTLFASVPVLGALPAGAWTISAGAGAVISAKWSKYTLFEAANSEAWKRIFGEHFKTAQKKWQEVLKGSTGKLAKASCAMLATSLGMLFPVALFTIVSAWYSSASFLNPSSLNCDARKSETLGKHAKHAKFEKTESRNIDNEQVLSRSTNPAIQLV